ncbi:MOSC domain-containing protein [Alkalibacter mobilis]|uniref:MOSC domain-containing protein n=1 Tax=Alkalibacter mobilis TaxID=2787712 RepID=UPI00189DA9C4|nr:MOSC domain-containing protein [Alkalibacter mobilis]MBF7096192.1 hypothetical protein [Alkalibacter mobilis]
MGFVEKIKIKTVNNRSQEEVDVIMLKEGTGISGSAFEGGDEKLQITLMESEARISAIPEKKDGFCISRFKENISTAGFDIKGLKEGDRLEIGSAVIEITIPGKKCYEECPVFKRQGNCGLWKSAAFAKTVRNGEIRVHDRIKKISQNV